MTHPSSLDLEAFALRDAGDTRSARANTAAHVAACSACSAFVEKVHTLLSGSPSAATADDAVARAVARMTSITSITSITSEQGEQGEQGESGPSHATAARSTEPRETRESRAKTKTHDTKRRLWLVTTSVITPLAAAVAILLLTRSQGLPAAAVPSAVPPPAAPTVSAFTSGPQGDRVLMGKQPHAAAGDPDTTFKGGPQIAVVRERAGRQERFVSVVPVRPGDRLRVEVALDREQAILGAVLADDGSYLELMPQGVRGAGTHFSEKSAKIDASPTRGTILIGTPEAVARARDSVKREPHQQLQIEGVATIRVDVEVTPP